MHIQTQQDLIRQLTRRNSQRSTLTPFSHFPHKRIKQTLPSQKAFYIIQNKLYILTIVTNFQEIILELNNISEAVSSPMRINQFEFTESSLLRAKALGYNSKKVKDFLCKNMRNHQLPGVMMKLIEDNLGEGQCPRLYLVEEKQKNLYYFQISQRQLNINPQLLQILKSYSDKVQYIKSPINIKQSQHQQIITQQQQQQTQTIRRYQIKQYLHNQLAQKMFNKRIPLSSQKQIKKNQHQQKMKNQTQLIRNLQALHCKDLKIHLKAFTKLRDYQSDALKSVVTIKQPNPNLIAKSGYIVLPCGAGKTLLGIAICTKIKKQTLIVCSNDSGCDQWRRQIQKWAQGIHKDTIFILTAKTMQQFKYDVKDKKGHIFISTYSNLKSKFDPKQGEIDKRNQWLKKMPWGLIIFDEAQWLPAEGNKLIVNSMLAHVKIGLTATPLRQDQCIKSLNYLIGPQLYVGSWKKFVQQGFLANPKCLQIRTGMTKTFKQLYEATSEKKGKNRVLSKQLLYESNPNKIKALMYLLDYHESLNDNIIVFCDRIKLITFLASHLKRPLLGGETSNEDRNFVYDMFRQGKFKTIFLTRIGDQAVDLPNANVGIQIAMNKGSRRQMMQRLGRIMRPKQGSSSSTYNAIFYTIVSNQTLEMKYFQKRRNYLVNLGFQYDLRLFQYSNNNNNNMIDDMIRSDPQKREVIEEKFKNIIPDQFKYHLLLSEQGEKDNLISRGKYQQNDDDEIELEKL